jgi:hypothetical protein
MMDGLHHRHPHEARRRERAVKPRQLYHLDNGAHARAFLADAHRKRIDEFDFARRIGSVAELVLQSL